MDPLSAVFSVVLYALIAVAVPLFLVITIFIFIYMKELVTQGDQAPIGGSVISMLINFNSLFDYQTSVARKHSTYRMLTPTHNELYTVDPLNVEHILKTNFINYVKGPYHYGILKDLFGDGIFAVDGEKWKHQRKLASHEFSTTVLRDFSNFVFLANAAKLVAKVSEAATSNMIIDLQEVLMKSTLDSIFKVGFGTELNSLSSDEIGFCKAFDNANENTYWRYVDPFWKIKRILNVGSEASLKRDIKVIDDFVFHLIKSKREQMKIEKGEKCTKKDILSRFLIESETDPENMTDKYLRDIILNFLIAGKDTTANTLTWFFYMLCKHPFIQEKIVQEVREATKGSGNWPIDQFTKLVTEEALDKMQYLHAALTETLRLYPAVPVDGKGSEKADILPDGSRLKKGDGINFMPYAMGRMTSVWGEDAEEFRPERWIADGSFRAESNFKFVTFQAGPRICLGKEFAYRQMKVLAAFLLNYFKFKLVNKQYEARYRTMFTLHMDKGLHLLVSHRNNVA